MKSNKDVSQLPDYPSLKKLASALWRTDNSTGGAAVMVGSGFSRAAARSSDDSQRMPLWNDFISHVKRELGREKDEPVDALKIAEEYRVNFSQNALNGAIERIIQDKSWEPGELYKTLLEFKWKEVLTTNWDTLLERGATKFKCYDYSVVSKQTDLTNSVSPRITKLHGTIGLSEKYIVAEEDYRAYLKDFGINVNFVRQVFIENALCLIGFSGDDPNFLQWIGWIRDNLQERAHNIYLVGHLGLTTSKRRYLESLNISPIDLTPLVDGISDIDKQHEEALKLFFDALQNEAPEPIWEWRTNMNKWNSGRRIKANASTEEETEYSELPIEKQLEMLVDDRKTYPNWLVAPYRVREDIRDTTHWPYIDEKKLEGISAAQKQQFLYEMAWRYQILGCVASKRLLLQFYHLVFSAHEKLLSEKQLGEIALFILRHARWYGETDEQLDLVFTEASKKFTGLYEFFPEFQLEFNYHEALLARDAFDFESVKKRLDTIKGLVGAENPLWLMRRASLYAELGETDEALSLTKKAFSELSKEIRSHSESLYLHSCWSWSRYLLRGYSILKDVKDLGDVVNEPEIVKLMECSSYDHFSNLKEVSKKLEASYISEMSPEEPDFRSGQIRSNSKSIFEESIPPLAQLDAYASRVGVPMYSDYAAMLKNITAKICIYTRSFQNLESERYFVLAIRAASGRDDEVIRKQFSRLALARTNLTIINSLYSKITQHLDYWFNNKNTNHHYVARRIAVLFEVLARLTIRLRPEQNKTVFLQAVSRAFHHLVSDKVGVYKSYSNLLQNSLIGIPESERGELLLSSLAFPIVDKEKATTGWPNPDINVVQKEWMSNEVKLALRNLIEQLGSDHRQINTNILVRLLPFCQSELLDSELKAALFEKLWDTSEGISLKLDTFFYVNGLLSLGCPEQELYIERVRSNLFDNRDFNFDSRFADTLEFITIYGIDEKCPILPTSKQATAFFGKLVSWKVEDIENIEYTFWDGSPRKAAERLSKKISLALSFSIVPSLPQSQFSDENFQLLLDFRTHLKSLNLPYNELLPAFVLFALKLSKYREKVADFIKFTLAVETKGFVYGVRAILKWFESAGSARPSKQIKELRDLLVSVITPTRDAQSLEEALWGCTKLLKQNGLSEENMQHLTRVLPILFEAYDYLHFNPYAIEAVKPPVVRKELVLLAKALINSQKVENQELEDIIEKARTDALPEVRFAAL